MAFVGYGGKGKDPLEQVLEQGEGKNMGGKIDRERIKRRERLRGKTKGSVREGRIRRRRSDERDGVRGGEQGRTRVEN